MHLPNFDFCMCEIENRERRVDLLSDIGRVGNEGEGGSPKRTPVDFFDGAGPPQQFQSLSQSSTSPSPRRRGAADKEIHFQKKKWNERDSLQFEREWTVQG